MKTIPYGRHSVSEEDIEAVVSVLRSDWLTQGPAVERFEQAVASYCGAKHAVAVCNGTAALHLACLAVGLGPGDTLWTSPITFVASANCALYCGASVDFVDIHPRTWNLDPAALEEKLVTSEREGKLPKVLVPVHFAGEQCDMERIGVLARRFGILVLEDACHALGARYRGMPIGSCSHSDMAVFSFHPVKSITTGEGGMVLTNRDDLAARLRLLRSHGITRDEALMEGPPHGPWYYQQVALGFNFRMPDITAALGSSQLNRLDAFVQKRAELAARYREALGNLPLDFQQFSSDAASAHHLGVIRVRNEAPKSRSEVFDAMRVDGIQPQVHYIPVHTQPWYRRLGFRQGDFPQAEAYHSGAISLPLFPALSAEDQGRVIQCIKGLLT